MKKIINGKTYNTETAEHLWGWDNNSTNFGSTLTPWGEVLWKAWGREPTGGRFEVDIFRRKKGKELFCVVRRDWTGSVTKVETDLSEREWSARLAFIENGYLPEEFRDMEEASWFEVKEYEYY